MSLPNTLEAIKTYIDELDDFPVDRVKQVRYGLTDSKEATLIVIGNFETVPDSWTTAGPTQYVSTFDIFIVTKKNEELTELAQQIDALFSMQQITPNTQLCELVRFKPNQEDFYRFVGQLSYRLQEST